eukprot:m51a1_g991 hypothetical protein (793) ;mRNA; f:496924-500111
MLPVKTPPSGVAEEVSVADCIAGVAGLSDVLALCEAQEARRHVLWARLLAAYTRSPRALALASGALYAAASALPPDLRPPLLPGIERALGQEDALELALGCVRVPLLREPLPSESDALAVVRATLVWCQLQRSLDTLPQRSWFSQSAFPTPAAGGTGVKDKEARERAVDFELCYLALFHALVRVSGRSPATLCLDNKVAVVARWILEEFGERLLEAVVKSFEDSTAFIAVVSELLSRVQASLAAECPPPLGAEKLLAVSQVLSFEVRRLVHNSVLLRDAAGLRPLLCPALSALGLLVACESLLTSSDASAGDLAACYYHEALAERFARDLVVTGLPPQPPQPPQPQERGPRAAALHAKLPVLADLVVLDVGWAMQFAAECRGFFDAVGVAAEALHGRFCAYVGALQPRLVGELGARDLVLLCSRLAVFSARVFGGRAPGLCCCPRPCALSRLPPVESPVQAFAGFLDQWAARVSESLAEWVGRAVAIDTWQPVGAQRVSSSLADVLEMCAEPLRVVASSAEQQPLGQGLRRRLVAAVGSAISAYAAQLLAAFGEGLPQRDYVEAMDAVARASAIAAVAPAVRSAEASQSAGARGRLRRLTGGVLRLVSPSRRAEASARPFGAGRRCRCEGHERKWNAQLTCASCVMANDAEAMQAALDQLADAMPADVQDELDAVFRSLHDCLSTMLAFYQAWMGKVIRRQVKKIVDGRRRLGARRRERDRPVDVLADYLDAQLAVLAGGLSETLFARVLLATWEEVVAHFARLVSPRSLAKLHVDAAQMALVRGCLEVRTT